MMNVAKVKSLLTLPWANRVNWKAAMPLCKAKLVCARRANDLALAADLSQVREFIKRRLIKARCEVCNAPISTKALGRCRVHAKRLVSQQSHEKVLNE
jgi:hypothetical protein